MPGQGQGRRNVAREECECICVCVCVRLQGIFGTAQPVKRLSQTMHKVYIFICMPLYFLALWTEFAPNSACVRLCVACMSRCKAPGFICLDGGLEALTHIGPCNALLTETETERRLWIYFTASRCACLFMSFYVAIFLCKCWRTTDGQATTCRGGWGGGRLERGRRCGRGWGWQEAKP